jgi:hypothetical protein
LGSDHSLQKIEIACHHIGSFDKSNVMACKGHNSMKTVSSIAKPKMALQKFLIRESPYKNNFRSLISGAKKGIAEWQCLLKWGFYQSSFSVALALV